ncbi:hypothetical protein OPT61_g4399 [Boeremia exigua]|uniref:Uncharacterized protein n=1 Tax=Boeremia exigua TaxID=749465 RepID=A0ACC2IE51_9PLEO|nr:hypothetical protein OPT61_g4399 [Boeremia exigua]
MPSASNDRNEVLVQTSTATKIASLFAAAAATPIASTYQYWRPSNRVTVDQRGLPPPASTVQSSRQQQTAPGSLSRNSHLNDKRSLPVTDTQQNLGPLAYLSCQLERTGLESSRKPSPAETQIAPESSDPAQGATDGLNAALERPNAAPCSKLSLR